MGLGAYDHGNLPFFEHFPLQRSNVPKIPRSIPFFFIFLRTLLRSCKTQPICFQAIPYSLQNTHKHSLFTRSSGVVYSLGCCGPW